MIKPPTLQQAVETHLREAILNGQIPSGEAIAMDELIEQLGVSRVPIRDALRVLEGEGLVNSKPRRGYVVTELSVSDLKELQEIRAVLEDEALNDARGKITKTTIDDMESSFDAMCNSEDSADYAEWIKAHRKFHFAIYELSANQALRRVLHQVWDASDIYRAAHMADADARAISKRQHEELLGAARSADVESMFTILKEHRATTVERLEGVRS